MGDFGHIVEVCLMLGGEKREERNEIIDNAVNK
jgi:hypothetical protein